MAIKCSQVTLPILFIVIVVVMTLNYLGLGLICSFYPAFPSVVASLPVLAVGYAIWMGLIESLPIGMVGAAYIYGEHERNDAAMMRAGASAAAEKLNPNRSLFEAISIFVAIFVADDVSSYLKSEIDQARIFSVGGLLLVKAVQTLYIEQPLLSVIRFVFFIIGFRTCSRVFVSE